MALGYVASLVFRLDLFCLLNGPDLEVSSGQLERLPPPHDEDEAIEEASEAAGEGAGESEDMDSDEGEKGA